MSETNKLVSKGINIPTPEEVIKKIKDFEKQDNQIEVEARVKFFKKANECQIGEKIATLISKQLKDKENSFYILISSRVNKKNASEYIELVLKPMFEQQGWITTVIKSDFPTDWCNLQYIAYWATSWFGNDFIIKDFSFEFSCNYIQILINSY